MIYELIHGLYSLLRTVFHAVQNRLSTRLFSATDPAEKYNTPSIRIGTDSVPIGKFDKKE